MRLNQFLAHAGLCSRRAADRLITLGKIAVNGQRVTTLATQVAPSDTVTHQGRPLKREKKHYLLLHKPTHHITTLHDPAGRPTVIDLIKSEKLGRLYPVGRLDYLTTGLLLLTNDGYLATKLAHPTHQVTKSYHVALHKPLKAAHLTQIRRGIHLADGIATVDKATLTDPTRKQLQMTLHIGRNRIIRRIFDHLGYHITTLTRTGYAHLTLQGLPSGAYRHLSPKEVAHLHHHTPHHPPPPPKKRKY